MLSIHWLGMPILIVPYNADENMLQISLVQVPFSDSANLQFVVINSAHWVVYVIEVHFIWFTVISNIVWYLACLGLYC